MNILLVGGESTESFPGKKAILRRNFGKAMTATSARDSFKCRTVELESLLRESCNNSRYPERTFHQNIYGSSLMYSG